MQRTGQGPERKGSMVTVGEKYVLSDGIRTMEVHHVLG
jgi:hypothetical protein